MEAQKSEEPIIAAISCSNYLVFVVLIDSSSHSFFDQIPKVLNTHLLNSLGRNSLQVLSSEKASLVDSSAGDAEPTGSNKNERGDGAT